MIRPPAAATALLFALGCASSGPQVQLGADAEKSPDGLHKVDGVSIGTLYMKPDYEFGSYESFVLDATLVAYAQGARVLDLDEEQELTSIFEAVARRAISGSGRTEAEAKAACVAVVRLALVDLDIRSQAGAIGAVTLVLEVRDGFTNEALLRYGQRRKLGGANLEAAFRRYSLRFQRDFNRAVPEEPPPDAIDCRTRAGPPAGPSEL